MVSMGDAPDKLATTARVIIRGFNTVTTSTSLGCQGEGEVVFSCSQKIDSSAQAEAIDVAATLAFVALQRRLITEQMRVGRALDLRLTQRTPELGDGQ